MMVVTPFTEVLRECCESALLGSVQAVVVVPGAVTPHASFLPSQEMVALC